MTRAQTAEQRELSLHLTRDGEVLYPRTPGQRETDTSRAAAEAIAPRAQTIRDLVHAEIIRAGVIGRTADEIADRLGLSPFTVRPRVSELRKLELITDSGFRRENSSGHRAIAWKDATPTSGGGDADAPF